MQEKERSGHHHQHLVGRIGYNSLWMDQRVAGPEEGKESNFQDKN